MPLCLRWLIRREGFSYEHNKDTGLEVGKCIFSLSLYYSGCTLLKSKKKKTNGWPNIGDSRVSNRGWCWLKKQLCSFKSLYYIHHTIRKSHSAHPAALCCSGCVSFSTIGILVVVAVITQQLNSTSRHSSLRLLARLYVLRTAWFFFKSVLVSPGSPPPCQDLSDTGDKTKMADLKAGNRQNVPTLKSSLFLVAKETVNILSVIWKKNPEI